jgi:hypothetical protein
MGYTITNVSDSVILSDGDDNNWIISKASYTLYQIGDKVRVVDNGIKMEIDYRSVDSPILSSGAELWNLLKDYKIDNPNTSNNSILDISKQKDIASNVTLNDMLEEIRLTNKLLSKIYNPE